MTRQADGPAPPAVPAVGARSWWLQEALRADPGEVCPALAGETTADVCVVGGGFAGLWTAYELGERDPGLGIALVEADIVGAGGSGANGGFFSPSWAQLSSLCASLGEEGGVAYAAALAAMVDELDGWIARHGARVDHWHEGILYARAGDWQPGPDEETFRLLERHGYADRLRRVDAAAARAVADSPRFIGGVVTPDLTVLQPGKLARELRRVLLERGVRIFEHTPMVRVENGRRPRVVTPGGAVSAGGVVLAHGAWAARERHFRRAFAVCTDFMVVTEPIPELIERIGWTSHMGVADLREMLYYLRRTADDRIAIGGGAMGIVCGARIRGRALTSPRLAEAAAHGLLWLFPQLEGVRFDAAWSGPMDITGPALPFFESAPGGRVHAGLGFSGHGLTGTRLGGKILASLVLGADDEWSRMAVVGPPLAQLPPEPLRWPLVQSVSLAYEASDRAHEQGRAIRACCRAPSSPATAATARSTAPPDGSEAAPPAGEKRGEDRNLIRWVSSLSRYLSTKEMLVSDTCTADRITEATRRLDVALSTLNAAFARDVGVSVPELLALENLESDGGLGPSELARRLQLSTGAVTALVDRLEASGHAARAAHPSDRRRIVVTRTAKASDALATEAAPLEHEIRRLAEGLSDDEREVVARFLDAFISIVERAAAEACAS